MEPTPLNNLLSREEALLQNPNMLAPEEIVLAQDVISVTYYGFDDHIHQGQIVIEKSCAQDISLFFQKAKELHFPIEKVIPIASPLYTFNDDLSCDDNNSSGYNFRYIAGTTRLSNHARGRAFDINPVQNPYVRCNTEGEELWRTPKHATYDQSISGTLHSTHQLVLLMKSLGWVWGGDWKRYEGTVDYQHFEKPD